MNIKEIIMRSGQLPASEIAEQVNESLRQHHTLVITAPPGAGKSTLLPLTIMSGQEEDANEGEKNIKDGDKKEENAADGGKVLMLEPRRLAARQIAERMASILGEPVGKTVGYRVRFDNKVSKDTRIEVLTEGILTRMLVSDPTLEGISTIIFDEFHERSINSDLALALARQTQVILRPDLRIVIMSATIDATSICQALDAPLIESKGRMYPVEVNYEDISEYKNGFGTYENFGNFGCEGVAMATATVIAKAHREHEGDILAFLPGQGEIQRCLELLGDSLSPTAVLPLYGNLSPEKQRQAIAPSREGERKVVLATPIAETSITIEGMRIVVDSGLYKHLVFDKNTGLSHLETTSISMDMATQRMGRAGRVAEGICYRLWAKTAEHLMKEQRTPEIEEADLSSMLLDIASFGENDIYGLPWLTLPPKANIMQAKDLLCSLGALEENDIDKESSKEEGVFSKTETRNKASLYIGSITPMGRKMEALPCHPRIARMILSAETKPLQALACDIAALLEEKDPMSETGECDITLRLSVLRSNRRKGALGRWARIALIAKEYRRMANIEENNKKINSERKSHPDEDNSPVDGEEVGMLLAHAYPERIAMAIDNIGGYRLASGNTVSIDREDPMSARSWIAIASLYAGNTGNTSNPSRLSYGKASSSSPLKQGKVFLAAPLNLEMISEMAKERDRIAWDSKQGMVVMQQERYIGKLVIDTRPIHDANKADIIAIICEAIKKEGLSMLDWNEQVQQLQRRVAKVAEWHPELSIPDLSTEHLMETAQDWLPFYLEQDGKVKHTITELKKLNLEEILWNSIPYDVQQEIDRLAPTHIQVPTGSRIRIDYRQGAEAPVLSVRLQECFGMEKTPCVNDGKQPLLMELLSPGFKPVQLTQDLQSFWKTTYFEVRKELKRRYPKHYWPENPLEAEAVRGIKRKS